MSTTTTPSKIIKYKCSLCFYDAFNKENVEKHIKKTKKCAEAQIIEIEIKCDFCDKTFSSEMSKINHEKICKNKKLEDELEGLSFEEQNKILRKKYHDQNKYVEIIEKQLRMLKYKFAREEEVNNIAMQNEHGLNANELHSYCIYTLKRLFEELTLPAVTTNLDLMKIREAQKAAEKAAGAQKESKKEEEVVEETKKTKSKVKKEQKPVDQTESDSR
jgi:hypothetical protein